MKNRSASVITTFFVTALSGALMLPGCEEDDNKTVPPKVTFTENLQNVTEGDEATILLTLDKTARGNIVVELAIETNAIYGQHFSTDPGAIGKSLIPVNIFSGEKSAEIKITTVDDAKFEGTRFIIFKIQPSSDLDPGTTSALTLTIGDDEGPSLVNFKTSRFTLNEKAAEGLLVQLPFSAPAKGEGSVTISLQPGKAVNGTNFTIDRELRNNSFSSNVVRDDTGISFTVFPVDGDLYTGNLILQFSVSDVSGVVQKGSTLHSSLTLVDDELPSVAQFVATSGMVGETSTAGIDIDVQLSSPVKGEGVLVVTFPAESGDYGADFTTVPEAQNNAITLNLVHDQTSARFTVFPVDDDLLTADLVLPFSIYSGTGPVWKGVENQKYDLTIVDDEEPVIANFELTSADLDETNDNGMEVRINFSGPAPGTGTIVLDISDHSDNFETEPAFERIYESYSSYNYNYDYRITLHVPLRAESVSFNVLPIDDSRCVPQQDISFTMETVSAILAKGTNQKFDLTINEDEPLLLVTPDETEGTVMEDQAAGKEVMLNFSTPASKNGSVAVYIDVWNHYGRYTTEPALESYSSSGYYFYLNFNAGATGVSFKILPANDEEPLGNFTEIFYFSYYDAQQPDGCVQFTDATYTVSFIDDD